MNKNDLKHESNALYTGLCAVKKYITIPLKRYEKTDLALELDKNLGFEHRTIYEDIEQTYYETISKYGHTNIKIKTNLIPPQKYKFAAEEVEIVGGVIAHNVPQLCPVGQFEIQNYQLKIKQQWKTKI